MRDQKRNCEATKIRAAGVVLVKFHHNFLTNTTPAPIKRWATPLDSAEEGTLLFSYCNSFTPSMTAPTRRRLWRYKNALECFMENFVCIHIFLCECVT